MELNIWAGSTNRTPIPRNGIMLWVVPFVHRKDLEQSSFRVDGGNKITYILGCLHKYVPVQVTLWPGTFGRHALPNPQARANPQATK